MYAVDQQCLGVQASGQHATVKTERPKQSSYCSTLTTGLHYVFCADPRMYDPFAHSVVLFWMLVFLASRFCAPLAALFPS